MSLGLQLKLLGLNTLMLVVIAANVLYINYIVRFRSGLNDTDVLRRFWTKADQLVLSPVPYPFITSISYGLGLNALVRSILTGILHLLDGNHLSLSGQYVVSCASTIAGAITATCLYRFDGGDMRFLHSASVAVSALPTGLLKLIFKHHEVKAFTWTAWTASIIILSALSSALVMRMITFRKLSMATRDPFEREPIESSKLKRFLEAMPHILSGILLIVIFALHETLCILVRVYVHAKKYDHLYLGTLLLNFAGLVPLISFSSIVIRITSKRDAKGFKIWRYSLPGLTLPIFFVHFSLSLCILLFVDKKKILKSLFEFHAKEFLRVYYVYLAVGFISVAAYCLVCIKASQKALDPGSDGQGELILDDEDYEEYDI